MRLACHFYYWILIKSTNSVTKITWWAHGGISKNIFPRPLFIIIFRPEMLKFHPYSILTGDTRVEFVIYCVLIDYLEWVGLFSFAQLLVDQKFFLCKRHKTQKIKEYMKSVLFYFPCRAFGHMYGLLTFRRKVEWNTILKTNSVHNYHLKAVTEH